MGSAKNNVNHMITKKIVFILPSISQPRCIRRINGFVDRGYNVKVYGFKRGFYEFDSTFYKFDIESLGEQKDNGKYIVKVIQQYISLREVIKTQRSDSIFYLFGFSIAISCKVLGCKKFVYEISDLLYVDKVSRIILWLFKALDRYLIKKSIVTVLTSKGFCRFLFKDKIPNNILIQPNKVDSYFKSVISCKAYKRPNSEKLVFSYVGAFRYPNTIFRFARIVGEKYKNHEFYFYGDSRLTTNVKLMANEYSNVKYFGPYKNPEDLISIYSNIDIVVACYDVQGAINERVAEPNKLYEALFFKKPIIVSKETYLSERVSQLGCGFILNASKDDEIINLISSLDQKRLNNIIDVIESIDCQYPIDDNSVKILETFERRLDKDLV
jgi:glycosyltransferase involved in cell wall biosynthesis